MKINNIENYTNKKNAEETSELSFSEQESSNENNSEKLNLDFLEIEKNYNEIINNPEANQSEKMEASIWKTRGKNLLYQGLALLSLATPLKAVEQNNFSSNFNQSQNKSSICLSKEKINS
jgi:hypothetical protein